MAEEWAQFVAVHAVLLLLGLALLVFLLTLVFWHLVQRYGTALWPLIVRVWFAISGSPLAARLRGVPMLGRFVSGTLTFGRSLGLYASAAFAVAFAGLFLFFEIAGGLGADEGLARFDTALTSALRQATSRDTLRLFGAVTRLGDPIFLMMVSAVVFTALLVRGEGPHGLIAAVTMVVIVFVGFSRVVLQVHYLSDVLAGYTTGAAWVALCVAGAEAVRRRRAMKIPGFGE